MIQVVNGKTKVQLFVLLLVISSSVVSTSNPTSAPITTSSTVVLTSNSTTAPITILTVDPATIPSFEF